MHRGFRQVVRMVAAGVPFNDAWNMEPAWRYAWCVALGEVEGRVYDWDNGRWKELGREVG